MGENVIDSTINRLNSQRSILVDYGDSFVNNSNYGLTRYHRIKKYCEYLKEQNPIINEILNPYEGNTLLEEILKVEIIKNIGEDEYENIYSQNNLNADTAFFGLSYNEEIRRDAYAIVVNRFFDKLIDSIRRETLPGNEPDVEGIIGDILAKEIDTAQNILQTRNFPQKDPQERIDELIEMSQRNRGDNHLAPASGLFKAYRFNISKITGIPEDDLDHIVEGFSDNVFYIRYAALRNRNRQQQNTSNHNQEFFDESQKNTIKRVLRQRGEDLSGVYLNCIKPFLSTFYNNTVEDPIKEYCLTIDKNIRDRIVIGDEEENNFKARIGDYLKIMNKDDLDMFEAIVAIPEIKQALNEKSLLTGFGDYLMEGINNIKNHRIAR